MIVNILILLKKQNVQALTKEDIKELERNKERRTQLREQRKNEDEFAVFEKIDNDIN